ncbi:NAD(P)/FAD-dependent oxidoreductase [Pedobacter aquatilis]|uniref:FAD-dependent oxidoreductase n=1 Tax=Pedobacter aquatilis TaxID=351343 RepID=UPI002930D090|nr:NAD(P)/FAD-dependent oxidoreductase [Pedobacter aquatilis]
MLLKDKKIAIVGGGPGGLTLARLLELKGASVKLYERDQDKSARQQGATLDLHYHSGLKALREAGLIDAFKKSYRPGAERVTIVDNQATVHYTERNEAPLEDLDSEFARPEIDRGPLRDLLIDSLKEDTIIWDSKFSKLIKNGEGWNLVFENGTTAYADLVIASDGANSKVRKYITDIKRIYSGVTIVEGNIYNAASNAPNLWKLTNGGKVYALWDKKTVVLSAKGEGSLSFYTISYEPEDLATLAGIDFRNKAQVFDWFKQRYADWSDQWHEIFSTDESYFVIRPQYHFPVEQSWKSQSNLTMIGDAAHVTPPSGEGVNQAMQDALELYEALCMENFDTIETAIAAFEKKMLLRTSKETQDALDMVGLMQSENNLDNMLGFFNELNDMREG